MARDGDVVEFSLADGTAIAVEVDEAPRAGFQNVSRRGGRRDAAGEAAPRSFSEALDRVRPMAEQLIERLGNLPRQPEKVEVEFGLKLSGEVGVIVSRTSAEANLKVTLSWTRA